MKYIKFILVGILFGIVMTKSQATSWYRIHEMFRFESIHMYGIIGVAVILGILIHLFIKKTKMKDFSGAEITLIEKPKRYKAAFFGGIIFGLGWAVSGACPGPLYTLVGQGYTIIIAVILSAVLGALVYGLISHKLPQ